MVHPRTRQLRRYHQQNAASLRRFGTPGTESHRRQRLPLLRRRRLVRLQRILLLRELGLGLPAIAEVLTGERDTAAALRTHLELLEQERTRISRQIESVNRTLNKTKNGESLMPEDVFDGFDHTRYKDEVIERWGKDAYTSGDNWWRSMSEQDRKAHLQSQADIAAAFGKALTAGLSAESDDVQTITRRQFEWIKIGWQGRTPSADAFTGLGQMYVDDPRFTANYDKYGEGTASLVRDAMKVYAERNLH